MQAASLPSPSHIIIAIIAIIMTRQCHIILQILKTVKLLKDKGRTRHSVLLYGHGDGGGGPT